MKYTGSFKRLARNKSLGAMLIVAMLGWAFGLPSLFVQTASAAQLTTFSATASSSAPSVGTSQIIRFTTTNAIGQGTTASTTRITFDPTGTSFSLATIATASDIFIYRTGGGLSQVANSAGCTASANEIYVSQVGVNQPEDFIEFTTCTGGTDTIAAGNIIVNVANAHITNPSGTGSYVVRIGGTMTDAGDTRVAIISSVTMTAIVDTNLTFTIAGVATGTEVNGDQTSTSSSATAIGFGVISTATSSVSAQDLTVATNALNGFSVTVRENQDLTSNNGANINAFKDGNAVVGAPTAWTAPVGTLGSPNTYGHMGITSDDSTLSGGDEFGFKLYAGLISTSTRTVLYHTGPADGTTQDIGKARVGYRIQITALQEAATDYTNVLTYVCTPIF